MPTKEQWLNIPHALYEVIGGEKKIVKVPFTLTVIDGVQKLIWLGDPPAELKSPNFIPYPSPEMLAGKFEIDPNTGIVTIKGRPDTGPEWVQVNWEKKTPGWTQNPKEWGAKYVSGFDEKGDPIFGTAPSGGGYYDPFGDFVFKVANALAEYEASKH